MAEVSFLKDTADDGLKIGVTLKVKMEGVNAEEAEELTEAAHQFCPYSKATRGKIEVEIIPEVL